MMQLEQIMLMEQHSTNDIATPLGNECTVDISYAGTPSPDGKPWPYEITYTIKIIPAAQTDAVHEPGGDAEEPAPKFKVALHYAARFSSEDGLAHDDALKAEASTAWPYARADFVQVFRLHGMPSDLIPAIPDLYVNQRTDNSDPASGL
ncbi:hypothetical protein LF919_05415 [Bifidobacterium pseudolongum]|uniref:hypothetical protein n=1 Tax=Bifidobacterium pseudolongum TaxID=1694 RepID=UPI001F0D11C9|nr:hypothetical protein [Bifidobacterium pseudolongum]MCH4835338.1 hypothetical protein [Bifidobacterium pseudolongum]